jgi:four helix bundle protein
MIPPPVSSNIENRIPKPVQNPNASGRKIYDLEERTLKFAARVIQYVNHLPRTIPNIEISGQLTRAAGSVGANYIEANESLGKKDFLMHIRISRKEAKESAYWLKLAVPKSEAEAEQQSLIQEATELMKIFGAILQKSLRPQN